MMIRQSKNSILVCLATGLFLLLQGTSFGAVINVPDAVNITTIQDGITAAIDGDEVVIADGIYTGAGNVNLDFQGKKITVRSAGGPAAVIIDCGNLADTRGVHFDNALENNQTILEGITIRNGSFDFGGGIRISGGASPVIRNVRIENNNATQSGGGVNVVGIGSHPVFENCIISGNAATSEGGGIRVIDLAMATLINCDISGNIALSPNLNSGIGGGLYVGNASVTVIGSTLSNNAAGHVGGGAAIFGVDTSNNFANVSIIGSVISGNTAGNKGGGLRFDRINPANTVVVINSLISGNDAAVDGAAVDAYRASPTFYNTTIAGNDSLGVPIINVHTQGAVGGDTGLVIQATMTFRNSILYGNSDPLLSSPLDANSFIFIDYSDVQGGFGGTGNIDQDPLFVNPAGNDYRLQSTSPAIDAGDNAAVPPDALDLDGDGDTTEPVPYDLGNAPRFLEAPDVVDTGNGTPPLVDMGAYEFFCCMLQFSAAAYTVDEGAGTATITVVRTGSSQSAVSVDFAVSDGTAISGSDYTAGNGTLNWADGDMTAKSFTINIIDDAVDESDETILLTLSNATGALLGANSSALLTIADNDISVGGSSGDTPADAGGGGGDGGGGCFISTSAF